MKIPYILLVVLFSLVTLKAAEPTTKPTTDEVKFLSASDLYGEPNSATGITKFMGRRVKFEIVVKVARDVPVVEIVKPEGATQHEPILAHVLSIGTAPGELKAGQHMVIEGIIVDEGYNAYMIYLHRVVAGG